MTASNTEIANLSLSHLGIGVAIGNLDTERSAEALACRTFYEQARRQTLRDYDWTFAHKIVALGLVTTEPDDEWAYSYQYPSDCLKFRRIQSGIRNDNKQSAIPYRIIYGASAREIYTDLADAVGEYTVDVTSVSRFTDDFVMAMSLRLAAYIAPRLTGGDPFKVGERAMRLYTYEVGLAAANSENEQQREQEPEAELIRARE